ncbi:hypothetical protein B0H19DRAFT_383039 [Mycena capillaripes]|nr:hypothetical protein B0H19DRAFT_383039 [Mycena capillaripes]
MPLRCRWRRRELGHVQHFVAQRSPGRRARGDHQSPVGSSEGHLEGIGRGWPAGSSSVQGRWVNQGRRGRR